MLTIFSASNYYAVGSNRGAYIKVVADQQPLIVQFISTKASQKSLTLWERLVIKKIYDKINYFIFRFRVSYVEEQAIKNLLEKFTVNKSRLMKEFLQVDKKKTGNLFHYKIVSSRIISIKVLINNDLKLSLTNKLFVKTYFEIYYHRKYIV